MSVLNELIDELNAVGGALEVRPPGDVYVRNPERVPVELKNRLRQHKAELLELLQGKTELQEARQRVEVRGVSLAVFEDGGMRVISTVSRGRQVGGGFALDTCHEMLLTHIALTRRQRRMLHEFNRRFKEGTEWKPR